MKTDALNMFKEEMNKRGLFRKIKVCVNLIPPPPDGFKGNVMEIHKLAAKAAIMQYATAHEDFAALLAEAALNHLLDSIMTDDLFTPDAAFVPTDSEREKADQAEKHAKVISTLLSGLTDILK